MKNYIGNCKFVFKMAGKYIRGSWNYGWKQIGAGLMFVIVVPLRYLYHAIIDPIFYAGRVTQCRKAAEKLAEAPDTSGQA